MVREIEAARHLPRPDERANKKPVKNHPRRQQKSVALTAYSLFVALTVGLVLLYIAQYAYVAKLSLSLAQAQKQLGQIQLMNEQLELQASKLRSLRRVEEEAINRLGMEKPRTIRTVKAQLEPNQELALAAEPLQVKEVSNHENRLWGFLNWARGLKKASASGIKQNH